MNKNTVKKVIFLITLVRLGSLNLFPKLYAAPPEPTEILLSADEMITSINQTITAIEGTIESVKKAAIREIVQDRQPYAIMQALKVPQNSNVIVIGDLHGDVLSLQNNLRYMRTLNCFSESDNEVLNKNYYLVFTGDYADRGYHGLEVWQIVMRLKQKNPDQVFILRGNHEYREQADNPEVTEFLFKHEIQTKYSPADVERIFNKFEDLWNNLPQALFIGTGDIKNRIANYMLCCHASLEPNLIGKIKELLNRSTLADTNTIVTACFTNTDFHILPKLRRDYFYIGKPTVEFNGFIWSDLLPKGRPAIQGRAPGTLRLDISPYLTNYFTNQHVDNWTWNVKCIMRGHEHNHGGVLKLGAKIFEPLPNRTPVSIENNDVFTFISTPEGMHFLIEDAFGIVKLAPAGWILTPYVSIVNAPMSCSRLQVSDTLREMVQEHVLRFVLRQLLKKSDKEIKNYIKDYRSIRQFLSESEELEGEILGILKEWEGAIEENIPCWNDLIKELLVPPTPNP